MPDPTLSAALLEAYASAPANQVIHHTLELWHPAFSLPIRVVRDNASLDARIEAGAARDAGAVVTFVAYAFDIVPPDQSSDALPQCVIEIDNVSRDIMAQLDLAVVQPDPITVIYRAYLSDMLDTGPENVPPMEMTITHVNATPLRIRAVAGFPNLLDRAFPSLDYDLEVFPGLAP
jgi:hypothetical protein